MQKQPIAKKYIKTVELAQLTGRPYNEILSLVNTGVLPGYKTHRGRWLIIINENHYREAAKTDKRMKGRTESTDTTERDYSWSCVSKYFGDFRDFCVRYVRQYRPSG